MEGRTVPARRCIRSQIADIASILTAVSIDRPDASGSHDGRRLSAEHAALGLAIRQLRTAAKISQIGLADRCNMHRTYVGGIERGERNVSFANLLRLARALDVPPSELLALAERIEHRAAERFQA
jgi:plasmid maintenance system antidote protein VapI